MPNLFMLRSARKRLFERRYYGRAVSEEYIESDFDRWNRLPPTRMRHCDRCGAEVRWYRESPQHSVRTGRPGHKYHLRCPYSYDLLHELDKLDPDLPSDRRWAIAHSASQMHYDSSQYRFREDDRESFDPDDLW